MTLPWLNLIWSVVIVSYVPGRPAIRAFRCLLVLHSSEIALRIQGFLVVFMQNFVRDRGDELFSTYKHIKVNEVVKRSFFIQFPLKMILHFTTFTLYHHQSYA